MQSNVLSPGKEEKKFKLNSIYNERVADRINTSNLNPVCFYFKQYKRYGPG